MESEEVLGHELEQAGEKITRLEAADYTPALAGGARESAGSRK